MATHSSILAWEIHGQRSLVGYSPQGHKESDTTEQLTSNKARNDTGLGWNFISLVREARPAQQCPRAGRPQAHSIPPLLGCDSHPQGGPHGPRGLLESRTSSPCPLLWGQKHKKVGKTQEKTHIPACSFLKEVSQNLHPTSSDALSP